MVDQGLDGLVLALVKVGVIVSDQGSQNFESGCAGVGHPSSVPDTTDTRAVAEALWSSVGGC